MSAQASDSSLWSLKDRLKFQIVYLPNSDAIINTGYCCC